MGDKIFVVGYDDYCGYCNWVVSKLYLLAESEEEAKEIYEKNQRGLCGDCIVELIIETHGEIVTSPEHVNA